MQATESSTDSETTETTLRDRSVDHTLLAEAIQETLGDLVCAVVLGDLLTQDEDLLVALELLGQGLVERISDGVLLDS